MKLIMYISIRLACCQNEKKEDSAYELSLLFSSRFMSSFGRADCTVRTSCPNYCEKIYVVVSIRIHGMASSPM